MVRSVVWLVLLGRVLGSAWLYAWFLLVVCLVPSDTCLVPLGHRLSVKGRFPTVVTCLLTFGRMPGSLGQPSGSFGHMPDSTCSPLARLHINRAAVPRNTVHQKKRFLPLAWLRTSAAAALP